MTQSGPSPIVFSEWLPTGVMVHFEGGVSVFFSARFLYEQREVRRKPSSEVPLLSNHEECAGSVHLFLVDTCCVTRRLWKDRCLE